MSAAAKSAYAPAPGTTAYRALAHLESLLPGAELMTSALAEAIGVSPLNVGPCLEAALKHGLVFRRQRDNHVRSPFWWSLQDHGGRPKADIRKASMPDWPDEQPARLPTSLLQLCPAPVVERDDEPDEAPRQLVGRTATVSMSGEVAIVAECGTVVLFDAERAGKLLEFCARVCE